MVETMAMMPASDQISCLVANAYGDPKRSVAITADALKTITRPIKTRSMVTAKSHRSTLTRWPMTLHFTTELRREGEDCSWKNALGMTGLVPRYDFRVRAWWLDGWGGRRSTNAGNGFASAMKRFRTPLLSLSEVGSFDCVRLAPPFAQDDRLGVAVGVTRMRLTACCKRVHHFFENPPPVVVALGLVEARTGGGHQDDDPGLGDGGGTPRGVCQRLRLDD